MPGEKPGNIIPISSERRPPARETQVNYFCPNCGTECPQCGRARRHSPFDELTLEEVLVASLAVAKWRKERDG